MKFERILPIFVRWRLNMLREALQLSRRMRKWDVSSGLTILGIVEDQYGHDRSRRLRLPVDAAGEPLPWYTYPAIDYLRQLDFRESAVFEYGAGYGTLFWSKVAKDVVTVEHDESWHRQVSDKLGDKGSLLLRKEREAYVRAIRESGKPFHVIVIDGVHRRECATEVGAHLAKDGLVILENSDLYPDTAAFLRDMGLLQVDFTGFGPVNDYTWTTSLFFTSTAGRRPLYGRQPMPGIGSLCLHADDDEIA